MAGSFQLIPTPLGLGSTPWVPGYMTLSMSSIKKPLQSDLSPGNHYFVISNSGPFNTIVPFDPLLGLFHFIDPLVGTIMSFGPLKTFCPISQGIAFLWARHYVLVH